MHVIAPAPFGGAESVVTSLVRGFIGRGQEISVVILTDSQTPCSFERGVVTAGAEVLPLRLAARAYRQEARELSKIMRRKEPGVVHTHGFRADVQAGRAARRLRIPRVSTVHGFTGGDLRIRVYETLQVRTLRSFEAVVAVSKPLAHELERRGVDGARLHMIRNAWCNASEAQSRTSSRFELGLPEDAFVIGWVGRVSAEKGCDVFIDAMARLDDHSIVACVIGEGPDRDTLARRAATLGLSERIRWCGAHREAGRLFSAFDGFVLSSRTEGTPIVLFEAMEAGVPIVTTSVGGVPDVVGETEAELVAPEDPRALAAAIQKLRADPQATARRAEAARLCLRERFAQAPWIDAYAKIYHTIGLDSARMI